MGKTAAVMLGRGSLAHNNRGFSTENVDPALTPNNIVFVQQNLRDAYQKIFGEALDKYNQKQKRNDRKIPDYLEHIRKSKNGEKLYHELVVQVGNREDTGIGSPDADVAKEILTQYYHDFAERNPNMSVFNAVIHMDEPQGTPHLHINFIPIGTGYKKGLDTQNSMRRALEQQGFDYEPTFVLDKTLYSASYGKSAPKIGGGRWLNAERAALGSVLEQNGIAWDKLGTQRENLSVSEYKACAEIISREIENMPPAELTFREPNRAMRLAGVKDGEVIVLRTNAETLRQENVALRTQADINRKTIQRMDNEQRTSDAFVQRAFKSAANTEQNAKAFIEQAQQEITDAKSMYEPGTAEKYQELAKNYRKIASAYIDIKGRYETSERQKAELEGNVPQRINAAVAEAMAPLEVENSRLRSELERIKQMATSLQERVRSLCQTLHDIMRAVFTLKYNYTDKSPNPYKSDLTDYACQLIDTLEGRARTALRNAAQPDLEKGIDGMRVTSAMEQEIRQQMQKKRQQSKGIGE